MANTSLILSNIDFDTHKNTLKRYLQSQDRFADYDFEGSNMSVLLDVLSATTFHNAFYLNMVGNEMFLDSAKLRDSVVSHAKELNYVPNSFTSAQSVIRLSIISSDTTKRTVTIPKGTTFTSRLTTRNFTFSTSENVILTDYTVNGNGTITFTGDVTIYEGFYVSDQFTYASNNVRRFVLTNKNIDISSISVTVLEDVGASTKTYTRASSLFDLTPSSQVFFVQGAENEQYEIVFGDGVTGRQPKDNSVVNVEYRVCNGELPNGAGAFIADGALDGETNITIEVLQRAQGGSVSESISSIKYNAPRHFTTQERAVTAEDYENLLKINFPEINTVSAFGGEDLVPPKYGKVFVAVDLTAVDGLPQAKKDEYAQFLRNRSPVSIEPVLVDPEYTYIELVTAINYNLNTTNLTPDDIRAIVLDSILGYAQTNLNNFNRKFRYSAIINAIDTSQQAILSNETEVRVIKQLSFEVNKPYTTTVKYQVPLEQTTTNTEGFTIQSTRFTYDNKLASLKDDGNGTLNVVDVNTGAVIKSTGTVDYEAGEVRIVNFTVSDYEGAVIKLYGVPVSRDITTVNNVILNILEEDVKLTITGSRE